MHILIIVISNQVLNCIYSFTLEFNLVYYVIIELFGLFSDHISISLSLFINYVDDFHSLNYCNFNRLYLLIMTFFFRLIKKY